jgi:ataxia telangiectasia mutated family protein
MTVGHVHLFAFATINAVLSRMENDDTLFARKTTRELVPLVSHWWHAQKVAKDEMLKSIRDEMLKVIFTVSLQLQFLAQAPDDGTLRKDLEDLLDTFWSEYSRRDAPSQLQLSDVNFGAAAVPDDYFRTPIFTLQSHNREGERNWAVLQCMAILESVLAQLKSHDRPTSAGSEQPRKRRRIAHEPSRMRRQLKSLDDGVQFTALQLIPFLADSEAFQDDEVLDIAADLAQLLSDKRAAVASWAMLGCAR